jgi:GntR family transcriptional regulator, transcriptional repressor for pyruvate dehydrogenase complex
MSDIAERFERINAAPAYQLVAEAIEKQITSGRLRAGEPLGTEAELVRQFGVNRSTVREGIRMLEQAGLVHRDSSRRLTVGVPHYERLASRKTRALVLHEVTFNELWEAVLVMDGAAVELAVQRATPAVIAEFEANLAKTEAAAGDWGAVAELDNQWHGLLYKAAGNRVLQLAREPAVLLNLPATELILDRIREGFPRLVVAHRTITEAIRKRDADNAKLWMRRHLLDWRRGFELIGKDLDRPIDQVYLREITPVENGR